MEKKKTIKKTTSKTKPKTKKTTTAKKTTSKKKKKNKGFTLIELLAVIIILGVLMIIAIPSVTTYISNSRKSSYVDTVKNLVGAARNLVNSGKVQAYDRNTTYYIPVSCLPTENGARTPYGDFTEAYVAVVYDGNGYSYYWTGTDSSHTGVKELVPVSELDVDKIETEVEDTDIKNNVGVGNRTQVRIIDKNNCNDDEVISAAPSNYYVYVGEYNTNYQFEYSLIDVEIMDIPAGATEFLAYFRLEYEPDDEAYINNDAWVPITITDGYFTCAPYNSYFHGSAGFIAFPTSYNNEYECNEQINNRALIFYKTVNTIRNSLYASNNKIMLSKLYVLPGRQLHFKLKFKGPNLPETNWYVKSVVVPSCLEANMEVEVYDEKKKKRLRKKIKDVTYDDLLLVWDFDKAEFAWAKPLWIKKTEETNKYHLLKFSDGSELKIITDHRIFNVEKKMFTQAMSDETPIGTTTLNSKGELVKLVSKETIKEKCEFCNIITERHINLFANGILTSWRINNLYPIEDLKFVKDSRKLKKREDFKEIDDEWFEGLRISESLDSKDKILDDIEYCKKLQK